MTNAPKGQEQCAQFCDSLIECDVYVYAANTKMCYMKAKARTANRRIILGLIMGECEQLRSGGG